HKDRQSAVSSQSFPPASLQRPRVGGNPAATGCKIGLTPRAAISAAVRHFSLAVSCASVVDCAILFREELT
ncbi:MAG: hypothetical protein P8X66_00440, partial [Maritimibacter sp.]